jgi:hypothetical protein
MPLNKAHQTPRTEVDEAEAPQPGLELVWNRSSTSIRSTEKPALKMPLLLWFTVGLLFLSTAVSYGFELYWTKIGMQYPYTSPLVARISYFDDLLDWVGHMHLMHTAAYLYTPGMVSYTAPGMVLYWILSLAGNHSLAAYMTMVALIAGGMLLTFGRQLRREGLALGSILLFLIVVTLTSYPLLFTASTANLEIALTALMVGSVWAYATGRHGLAAVLIGVATATKFYPAALLLLYFNRRQWPRIVQAAVSAALTTLVSLWIVYPHIIESWNAIYGGGGTTANFMKDDVLIYNPGRAGFDHAFWSLWKTLTSVYTYTHQNLELMIVSVTAAAIVFVLWLWRVQWMSLWERITFLVCAMLLLMPMSNDYRLMALYVPFGLLVLAIVRGKIRTGLAVAVLICYTFQLTPLGYGCWEGQRYAAQAKCCILVILIGILAAWGRRELPAEKSEVLPAGR